jgi:RNA polymerase sigma-70 factor (ECF subfamily)
MSGRATSSGELRTAHPDEACGAAPAVPWRELRGELRRFVAARVAASDVDDVVQEALIRIQRGISTVRDPQRLAPWMYQVTRNAIVDHHRRPRRTQSVDDVLAEQLATESSEDDGLSRMLALCMSGFVAQLPPVYRQAITLVELEGLTQVEAAARLGISVSTMKSRVQRGRAQLRRLVEACCKIDLDARGHVIEATPRSGRCASC